MTFARGFRLAIGVALLVVPLWVLFTRLDPIWNGHPAFPTTLLVTAAVGLVGLTLAAGFWRTPRALGTEAAAGHLSEDAGPTPTPTAEPTGRSRGWRIVGRVLLGVLLVGYLGILGWLRPFPAGPASLAATRTSTTVTVVDAPTVIELRPARLTTPAAGLVFSPGARVDARAYAGLLRPVAEAGYLVVILKPPFGLAIASTGQAAGPVADHPEIARWAVGGHSLGGVSAAWFAADHRDQVAGLLLWGSYPNDDMSGAAGLQVESVYGSNDGLTTVADIESSRRRLPADAGFTEIDGGVHAFFGDYGEQPGDGQPTISREDAAQQISTASVQLLQRIAGAVPGP